MLTAELQEVIKVTNKVFDSAELKVPEPSHDWKRKLEALEEAKLTSHRSALLFDMRCWQAKQMGFQQIDSNQMVKMLMGDAATDQSSGAERQTYEWMYNHHTDQEHAPSDWGGNATVFERKERAGFWYMPPFSKITKWSCSFGKVNYLKRELPYGVVLRMNEVRKLKLFNCFNVLAPKEAWERKTDIDPILVATIWEITKEKEGHSTAGQVAHFFLAQW
jgi:hypothetical protein